jgi:hypothetical protein
LCRASEEALDRREFSGEEGKGASLPFLRKGCVFGTPALDKEVRLYIILYMYLF